MEHYILQLARQLRHENLGLGDLQDPGQDNREYRGLVTDLSSQAVACGAYGTHSQILMVPIKAASLACCDTFLAMVLLMFVFSSKGTSYVLNILFLWRMLLISKLQ